MDHIRRDPPATEEGWYVLHDLRRVDWDAWRGAPDHERERALDEGIEHLRAHEDLTDADAGGSAVFSVVGHKADLMVVHMRPTTAHLDRAERGFEQTALANFTERTTSYVSVTEISGYMTEDLEEGLDNIEDAGRRNYMQTRLYPPIPDSEHVCFYPMDKRRDPEYNWYDLPFDERRELISGHGEVGREYAGKVTQIITGSLGFDDYEWGVTLFADDATQIKKLLYQMRFDPSSSKYAEFGPFYFGRRIAPEDLPALLAGEAVPSDGGTSEAAHGASEGREAAAAHANGGEGVEHAHGGDSPHGSDSPHGEGSPHDDDHHGGGHHDEGGDSPHDDGDDSEGDHPDTDSGGRPSRPDEPPHEVVERRELEKQLHRFGVDRAERERAGYGLVFESDADAEDIVDDVDGLRGNFEHYDTHVTTAVRADAGQTAVVSLWANERAANVASGFLGDLPGAQPGIGASLGDPAEADGEDGAADGEDDHDAHGEASDEDPEPVGTDEDDGIRGELADLDIYGGQPHGEDIHAIVVYSEADPETLTEEVGELREAFEKYGTHVRTSVYEDREGGRTAVVSLWDTQSAAKTAGDFLSELPDVVARAGEESGFGTMGMFYTVKPDYREEFVETFGEVGGMLAGMDGHHDSRLMVNRENENDMFISSQWRSREDALAFFRSDAFRDTVQWGREVLADRPRHVFLA
jgi:chlorite dismutase